MSISVKQLETLLSKLHNLASTLENDARSPQSVLRNDDRLVTLADECEFPLPRPLTIENMKATVGKKIDNVHVLLDRARMHQQLPLDAQDAADQEDDLIEQNYTRHESVYGLRRE